MGVHSGPNLLFLEGNTVGDRSVLTVSDGGSDRRTVTMESWPSFLSILSIGLAIIDLQLPALLLRFGLGPGSMSKRRPFHEQGERTYRGVV